MGIVRKVPVTDRNGEELQDRRFLRKVRRWKLCTGELVEERGDGFVIAVTGERLTKVVSCT